jgi:hypothetical protein
MSWFIDFFKRLLKPICKRVIIIRPTDDEPILVRSMSGLPTKVLNKPTVVVGGSKIMLDSPINEEISFTDLGNNEYICKGKHVKPRQVTEPFVCNRGVNCPWTDEIPFPIDDIRFTSREVCLKYGKVSAGSCQ